MKKLLLRLKNNENEAFEEIIKKYGGTLFLIAKAKIKNDALADDAVRETFISLYENVHRIKDGSKLKSWLTKVLINKCNDLMRKNKIYSFLCDYNEIDTYVDSKNEYEKLITQIDIYRTINKLNNEDRVVLLMYYSKSYTIREMSKILIMKENTIKTKISRIKKKILKILEEENKNG